MAETKTSEEYDGTNWSAGGEANTAGGEFNNLAGTQTSALCGGGYVGSYNAESESYDGSSWSTSPANPSADQAHGSATAVSTSDYLLCGGVNGTSQLNTAYTFDGSSWTTEDTLSNTRFVGNLLGTTGDANYNSGSRFASNDSENWNGSAWSSGPAASNDRYSPNNSTNCGGTKTSAVLGGGTGTDANTASGTIQHLD